MYLTSKISTCLIINLLINPSPAWSCSNVGKNAGQSAAREVSEAATRSATELRVALESASKRLETAMKAGVDATKEVVKELAGSISELAKSVSVKIDSSDLKDAGKAATENLRDAIAKLSENWNLSINTADLRSIGAEAAMHLADALKNIEVVVKLYVEVDVGANVVRSVMYISIAFGIGFSVCCIAMVISLKSCRKCTVALFTVCVESCSRNRRSTSDNNKTTPSEKANNASNIQDDPRRLLHDDDDGHGGRGRVYNKLEEKLDQKSYRKSMGGFGGHKFSNLKNFWNNPQPNSTNPDLEL